MTLAADMPWPIQLLFPLGLLLMLLLWAVRSPLARIRALLSGSAYFLILFGLGFVLGTIRVMLLAPRVGELAATLTELPIMLTAAYFACRWSIRRWQVPRGMTIRGVMALWFLTLLLLFEMLIGATLFGRTAAEQWAALTTPAGLLGLIAQTITGLFPLFIGKDKTS